LNAAIEQYDDDELVTRLLETRETLRQKHEVGKTLQEQLAEAIASEQYEVAARIRDELNRRNPRGR
jgi:protein-arginine kinase activator protein McsA